MERGGRCGYAISVCCLMRCRAILIGSCAWERTNVAPIGFCQRSVWRACYSMLRLMMKRSAHEQTRRGGWLKAYSRIGRRRLPERMRHNVITRPSNLIFGDRVVSSVTLDGVGPIRFSRRSAQMEALAGALAGDIKSEIACNALHDLPCPAPTPHNSFARRGTRILRVVSERDARAIVPVLPKRACLSPHLISVIIGALLRRSMMTRLSSSRRTAAISIVAIGL